jgi:acyl-CoA synthetase (NDP forming)
VGPATVRRLQDISPAYLPMRNPVDIWGSASTRGVEFAYGEGMEAVLKDANIDAVVPILMLARDSRVPPSYQFILDLAKRYPEKPVLVSFSGEKECEEECKAFLEPQGVPTFAEIEQPFEALAILLQCQRSMDH